MKYRNVHILAAIFFVIGMAVHVVVFYHVATNHVKVRMNLQMEVAQQKLLFDLYDAYAVTEQLEDFIEDDMTRPEELFEETRTIIKRFPNNFSCYVAFPEYRFPEKGRWYCPCAYRIHDSIFSVEFGDNDHDYFTREWYKGALESNEAGFWTHPYVDDDFDETIFTYSDDVRDKNGNLVCVIASDFSVSWLHRLLNSYKPFEEAVLVLFSSKGDELAVSGQESVGTFGRDWIVSRKTLSPMDIDLVIAVPQHYIWKSIRLGILLPLGVFLLGIIVVAVFLRHLWKAKEESARLELVERDLQIANQIQMGILRHDFPQDEAVQLQANLIPMREVGGDLYDFHQEGHELWFIIGDVSGKGVPAAMFMSATVNLFRAAGRRLDSPKAIMEEMNFVLSDNNPSLTFVTAFIGKLNIKTGQLLYCNAGHCAPLIAKTNGKSISLNCEPNIPLGYKGNFPFMEQGCLLGEEETLVLYTDGVTEARNTQRLMLGNRHWAEIVAQGGDLLQAVKTFIGDAEPTDDITLMTIRKTGAAEPLTMCVPNRDDRWPVLRQAIHEYGLCLQIEKRTLKKMEVATEEAVVNILHYSQAKQITLTLSHSPFTIRLEDDGIPFDPTTHPMDTDVVAERQIGGLGICLIRQIADELSYRRVEDKNQLTIIKNI